MEFKARQNLLRVSPRKLRLLVDLARGKSVQSAIEAVQFEEKKWSLPVVKLIRSAINNASQQRGVNVDNLYVKTIFVDKGPTIKRFMTRARGGAAQILRRTASMTVIVAEK